MSYKWLQSAKQSSARPYPGGKLSCINRCLCRNCLQDFPDQAFDYLFGLITLVQRVYLDTEPASFASR